MNIFNAYTVQNCNFQTCKPKMNAKEFLGKDVIEDRGWRVGKVRDVIIDPNTWEVKAFEVALEKEVAEEYGIKKMFGAATVPVRVEDVKSVGDAIMLKGSKLTLSTMPELGPMDGGKAKGTMSTTEKDNETF